MKVISFFLLLFWSCNLASQITVYQDVFHGGVTGGYFKTGYFNLSDASVNINIDSNSSIRKAYLFVNVYNKPENRILVFNGSNIELDEMNALDNTFEVLIFEPYIFKMKTLIIDVSNLVSPTQNTYNLLLPTNQPSPTDGGCFTGYYLFVTYENPIFDIVSTSVIVNNQNSADQINYTIENLNHLDSSKNISLSLDAEHFCDTVQDGSFVNINNINIGLIGGNESNEEASCAGISGAFYYKNGVSFGIGNDTADSIMKGNDGLANIEQYIEENTALNVLFDYQSNLKPKSNPVYELFLAYSTPCQPQNVSITPDTTICPNAPFQLSASGGIAYEWLPEVGLSCYDCPNPVFLGDSSRLYTVRIWGSDSCSVVRPVMIHVRKQPKTTFYNQTTTLCGEAQALINWQTAGNNSYSLNDGVFQSTGVFNQVAAGNQLLTVRDAFGCRFDTVVAIDSYLVVNAGLLVSPTSGVAPLEIQIANQSTNFTDWSWRVNNAFQSNVNTTFQAVTGGNYEIELIAWQNDSTCADTAVQNVFISETGFYIFGSSLVVGSSISQNTFFVYTNGKPQIDISIYDAQGRLLKTKSKIQLTEGANAIWNSSEMAAIASEMVFYKIHWQTASDSGALEGKTVVLR